MAGEAIAAAWAAISDAVVGEGAAAAGSAAAGSAGAAAGGAAAGTAAGLTTGQIIGASVTSAAVGAGLSAALAPKMPGVKAPVAMPDQQSVQDQQRRAAIEQMARRGRASTILTDPSGDTLG